MNNILIVGSGLFGSTIARLLAEVGQNVTVIDKRNHIGGNCYSKIDERTGIEIHKYGEHIFHTSIPEVKTFIERFTAFNHYRHTKKVFYKGKLYSFPINLDTINQFYNRNLKPWNVGEFWMGKVENDNPKNFEEAALSRLGKDLYEAFYKTYTLKHWERDPRELPAEIFSRLPIRMNYETNYFYDDFQGLPLDGYAELFKRMLNHANIRVILECDYFDIRHKVDYDFTIYTGTIDKLFNYQFGRLEWRTVSHSYETKQVKDWQGIATINYSDMNVPYTRTVEFKHLHPERKAVYESDQTIVSYEYASPCRDEHNPCYPIPDKRNQERYELYLNEVKHLKNFFIGGRLAEYKYYDMDKTIQSAINLFEKIKGEIC